MLSILKIIAVKSREISPASIYLSSTLSCPGPHKVSFFVLFSLVAPECMVLAKGNVVRVAVIIGIRIHVAAELVVRVAVISNSDLLNTLIAWEFRVFILAAGGKHLTVRHSGGITLLLLYAVSYQFGHVDLWLPSKWCVH